ncbi:hypothetical protein BACEGG_02408 [Bacteroides eggerthii DSM 20697]|nr:hypothetical protein BACEGG_02408 [Bacteroides eggerthii DSM 20697]
MDKAMPLLRGEEGEVVGDYIMIKKNEGNRPFNRIVPLTFFQAL